MFYLNYLFYHFPFFLDYKLCDDTECLSLSPFPFYGSGQCFTMSNTYLLIEWVTGDILYLTQGSKLGKQVKTSEVTLFYTLTQGA